MFGRRNKEEKARSKVDTVIGQGTKFQGEISAKGSLRIDGEIEGQIDIDGDLFIGKEGKVSNYIKARTIVVSGLAEGEIEAKEMIEILAGGKINGNIKTKLLKIEEGAAFEGSSTIYKNGEGKTKTLAEMNRSEKEAAVTNQ